MEGLMTRFQFSGELFPTETRMLNAVAEAWLSPPGIGATSREIAETLENMTDEQLADEVLESEWTEDETWNRDGLINAFARARAAKEAV
jgi:hypothetical protein